MRNLSRITVVLACTAALLALPAQATPKRSTALPTAPAITQWLGALWGNMTHLLTFAPSQQKTPGQTLFGTLVQTRDTSEGGSCIDPDGCK